MFLAWLQLVILAAWSAYMLMLADLFLYMHGIACFDRPSPACEVDIATSSLLVIGGLRSALLCGALIAVVTAYRYRRGRGSRAVALSALVGTPIAAIVLEWGLSFPV